MSLVAEKFLNIQLEYLGFVLNDANVSKAVMQQKPLLQLYPNTPAALTMLYLANKLQNNEHTIMYKEKGIKRLFTNLIHARLKR